MSEKLKPREPYRLVIQIPGLPRMANASGGSRTWQAQHKNTVKWKNLVANYAWKLGRPPAPIKRARVTCIRYSSTPPDADGLVAGFKPLIDGLVAAKVLENDRWENIGMPVYRWEQVPPKAGGVEIWVEEILASNGANHE